MKRIYALIKDLEQQSQVHSEETKAMSPPRLYIRIMKEKVDKPE